jgi:hypothetical protein
MQNMAATVHRCIDSRRVTNVTGNDFYLTQYLTVSAIEPAPGIKGVVVNKRTNVMACSHQLFGEVRANKSICACYQYLVCHDLVPLTALCFLPAQAVFNTEAVYHDGP